MLNCIFLIDVVRNSKEVRIVLALVPYRNKVHRNPPFMLWKFVLLCAIYSLLLIFPQDVSGTAINRTIDDEYGDSETGLEPIFLPNIHGAWDGENCIGCRVVPDKSFAFRETFNAATFRPEIGPISIGLSFKGTAIYVFFIIANFIPDEITTLTECNFTLDGQHVGYYRHDPTSSTDFQYNVSVFSTTGLANVDHNLNISTNGVDYHVFVNFDYAIYTFDDTPDPISTNSAHSSTLTTSAIQRSTVNDHSISSALNTPTQQFTNNHSSTPVTQTTTNSSGIPQLDSLNKPHVGTIVGGVMGGFVVLGLLLLLIFCWRRKRSITIKNLPLPSLSGYDGNHLVVNAGPSNGSRSLDQASIPFLSQHIPGYIRDEVPNITGNPNLPIIGPGALTISPVSISEARNVRRGQLERQLHVVERRESAILGTGSPVLSRQLSFRRKVTDANVETTELRRQIAQMREQIQHLQTQNFPEPPPSYSE